MRMDWFGDLWSWAADNGSVGALVIAALVTVFAVLIAGNVVIWTLVGLRWVIRH
jgi:hypothetical protein